MSIEKRSLMFRAEDGEYFCVSSWFCTMVADYQPWKETHWARTVYDLMLAGFCCLAMIGCDITRPVNVDEAKRPVKPDTPVVEVIDVATVYQALATACTNTPTKPAWINNTKRLARVVKLLENDVPGVAAKFDELFPGDASSERALTSGDIEKLRGVK